MKIIAQNKKAFFDYEVLEKYEAGIALNGDEVKAIRAGNINLTGSFVTVHNGQLNLINVHISPYSHAFQKPSDEYTRRTRPLLLHRREINKLIGAISRGGFALVPLKVYFNDRGFIKIEIGLCRHKKAHEQKEAIRERDIKRETRRELSGKYDY